MSGKAIAVNGALDGVVGSEDFLNRFTVGEATGRVHAASQMERPAASVQGETGAIL